MINEFGELLDEEVMAEGEEAEEGEEEAEESKEESEEETV